MNEFDVELVPADQLLEEWDELSSSVAAPFYSRPDWFVHGRRPSTKAVCTALRLAVRTGRWP